MTSQEIRTILTHPYLQPKDRIGSNEILACMLACAQWEIALQLAVANEREADRDARAMAERIDHASDEARGQRNVESARFHMKMQASSRDKGE